MDDHTLEAGCPKPAYSRKRFCAKEEVAYLVLSAEQVARNNVAAVIAIAEDKLNLSIIFSGH
jgi:hypothetical protein